MAVATAIVLNVLHVVTEEKFLFIYLFIYLFIFLKVKTFVYKIYLFIDFWFFLGRRNTQIIQLFTFTGNNLRIFVLVSHHKANGA